MSHSVTLLFYLSPIPSTSGRFHSEFIRLLFLQTHRETDHFFEVSGSQFLRNPPVDYSTSTVGVLGHPESRSRQDPHEDNNFTYHTKCWWDTYHFKNTYSPITPVNISFINLVFGF
jgi:hypothetical protein